MNGRALVLRGVPLALQPRSAACLAVVLVAAPFLFSWTSGPVAGAWQALFGCACALLLAVRAQTGARAGRLLTGLALAALLMAAAAAWHSPVAGLAGWVVTVGAGVVASGWPDRPLAVPDSGPRCLAHGLVLAGCVSAVVGLFQYFGQGGLLIPWGVQPAEPLGMAYGNLRQRNQFASLLGMAFVALLWVHAAASGRRRAGWWACASALLVIGLAASTSRTGLLELGCIVGMAGWLAWKERRNAPAAAPMRLPHPALLLAALPLYALAAWALPCFASGEVQGMMVRLREGAPPGHGRLVLWRNVLERIAQHPWRGWGWGELSYAHYTHLYAGERFVEILDNAHNLPLHLAVTLGVPAAVAICGGFAWGVARARPWAERDPARLMAWGVLGVLLLHSLLEYPLWYGPFQLVFGLCLGFLRSGRADGEIKQKSALAPVLPAVAATFLIAILSLAAWDYTRVSQIYLPPGERLPAWREHTLDKLRGRSWFFGDQVKFAELTLTPITRANAQAMYELAGEMLHFSPEARVVVRRIEAASLLGRDDEVAAQLVRFRAAYPEDYIRWLAGLPPG